MALITTLYPSDLLEIDAIIGYNRVCKIDSIFENVEWVVNFPPRALFVDHNYMTNEM